MRDRIRLITSGLGMLLFALGGFWAVAGESLFAPSRNVRLLERSETERIEGGFHGGFVLIAPHAKTQILVPLRLPAIVRTTIQIAVFNTTQDTTTVRLRSQAPAVGIF